MSENANVIKHAGHTLFRNSVVGVVDETGDLITVGSLTTNLGERMLMLNVENENLTERVAELSDALRVLMDEVIEERKSTRLSATTVAALGLAVSVLSGKACQPEE